MDAPRGLEVMPMTKKPEDTTSQPPLKSSVRVSRRTKGQSVLPTPIVAEVDTFPTHPQVPLTNTRWNAPLQATEGSRACNTVAVSDPDPGTIALPTADSPAGVGEENLVEPEGQGQLSDAETEGSGVSKMPWSAPKLLAPIFPQLKPSAHPQWLERCRKYIEDCGKPLDKPFTGVSEKFQSRLEDAAKTRGGPKAILPKVAMITHDALVKKSSDVFKDDNMDGEEGQDGSDEENSPDLLECVRQMMVLEASIQESSKTALKGCILSEIPPGGILGRSGAPGKSIPAMAGLSIDEYSNATYWQFAPYLEHVRCGSGS